MPKKIKREQPHKKSVKRQMRDEANTKIRDNHQNDETKKTYRVGMNSFITYCRNNHPEIKDINLCKPYIQEYSVFLQEKGYTASTIHTYLAAVCGFYGVNMEDIQKPKRYVAEFTRGRTNNGKIYRPDNDPNNPKFAYSVAFQKCVGIRRAELIRLTGADLVTDESGHLCVRVKRGKGGKMQLQRILPQNEELVKSYFDGKGETEKIFKPEEISSHMPYHSLRQENAKNAYYYYLKRINAEEGYAEQLARNIKTVDEIQYGPQNEVTTPV